MREKMTKDRIIWEFRVEVVDPSRRGGKALEATAEQIFLIWNWCWQMTKIIYTLVFNAADRNDKIISNQVTKITAALFMCLRFGSMEMNPLQDPPLSPRRDGPTSYDFLKQVREFMNGVHPSKKGCHHEWWLKKSNSKRGHLERRNTQT